MNLLTLAAERVRSLPDRTFAMSAVTIVTGRPGSGKTALLEAIVALRQTVAPNGALPEWRRLLRAGASDARIAATWRLTETEQKQHKAAEPVLETAVKFKKDGLVAPVGAHLRSSFPKTGPGSVVYFPANRRLGVDRDVPPLAASFLAPRQLLSSEVGKFSGVRGVFLELARASSTAVATAFDARGIATREDVPDVLAPYKLAVAEMCPDLRLVGVAVEDGVALVRFKKRSGEEVELDELSDSEQQAVLFAVAFRNAGIEESLVLVDTPELHIHPADHAAFFGRICELGTGNQVVATTTSPAILAAARPEQIVDLSSSR